MTFQESKTEEFLKLFQDSMQQIRHFPGCLHLELLQENGANHIFYTYSHWISDQALENYKHSDLFKSTWDRTRLLFAAKPEAVSLSKILKVN